MSERKEHVGAVIIGRNEGQRLIHCIESVIGRVGLVVYVDSGSTDDSVAAALQRSAHIVELERDRPFTAARARNAGVAELERLGNGLRFVQFIDGDCELQDGWLDAACEFLSEHDDVAVVCGRRRERFPEQSVYNRMIDMEWDTPVGEADSCGGDALVRLVALHEVGRFNETLIAGEEPEFCVRLRRSGWRVHRLDHEMTLHDANIGRFGQWWRRTVRCGHAYAEGRFLHGATAERFRVDEVRSVVEWALMLPLVAIGLAWWTWGLSLLLLGAYVLLALRVRRYWLSRGYPGGDATRAAWYNVIAKFAELLGIATFWLNRLRGRRSTLIEYKSDAEPLSARFTSPSSVEHTPQAVEAGGS